MRLLFLLLLFANLILFAWGQGYFGTMETGREPARLARQIAPDRIVLVREAKPEPRTCRRVFVDTLAHAEELARKASQEKDWKVGAPQALAEPPAHWLIVPQLANAAVAEKKKAEYLRLGAKEAEPLSVAGEIGPYVLSLGVFREESHARALLEELSKKGARTLRIVPRDLPPQRHALDLEAPAAELERKLSAWLPTGAETLPCAGP